MRGDLLEGVMDWNKVNWNHSNCNRDRDLLAGVMD